MTYFQVSIPLSPAQVSRLFSGASVVIKPTASHAGVVVPLTKTQVTRINKAQAAGKGYSVKLSQAQLDSAGVTSVTQGDGILSNALSAAKNVSQSLLTQYGQQGLHATHQAIGGLTEKLPPFLKPFEDAGVALGAKHAEDQLRAIIAGIHSTKNGSGLFAPGRRGGGLFLPGLRGGQLSDMTSYELSEYIDLIKKQVASYVHDTMGGGSGVTNALASFGKDCAKLVKVLEKEASELE
jgi:hypothetical protein